MNTLGGPGERRLFTSTVPALSVLIPGAFVAIGTGIAIGLGQYLVGIAFSSIPILVLAAVGHETRTLGRGVLLFGWVWGAFVAAAAVAPRVASLSGELELSWEKLGPYAVLLASIVLLLAIGQTQRPLPAAARALLAYVAWLAIASSIAPTGLFAWYRWAQGAVVATAGLIAARTGVRWTWLFWAIVVASLTHALTGFISLGLEESVSRLGGLVHPNVLSFSGVVLGLAGLHLLLVPARLRLVRRTGGLALFAVAVPVVWLAHSRDGAVAFALGICAFILIWGWKAGSGRGWLAFTAVTIAIAALVVFYGPAAQWFVRGHPEEVSTLTGRVDAWRLLIGYVWNRPFLGYGAGALRAGFFPDPLLNGPLCCEHAHNALLEAAVNSGVVGALLWVGMVVLGIRSAWASRDESRSLTISLWVALIINSITEAGAAGFGLHWYLLVALLCLSRPSETTSIRRPTSRASVGLSVEANRLREHAVVRY
jgi:O-antigen ligase